MRPIVEFAAIAVTMTVMLAGIGVLAGQRDEARAEVCRYAFGYSRTAQDSLSVIRAYDYCELPEDV